MWPARSARTLIVRFAIPLMSTLRTCSLPCRDRVIRQPRRAKGKPTAGALHPGPAWAAPRPHCYGPMPAAACPRCSFSVAASAPLNKSQGLRLLSRMVAISPQKSELASREVREWLTRTKLGSHAPSRGWWRSCLITGWHRFRAKELLSEDR